MVHLKSKLDAESVAMKNAKPKNLKPIAHRTQNLEDLQAYQRLILNPVMDGSVAPGLSSAPAFASVAATFNFQHHVGADPALELEVLKNILIREGYIVRVRDCVAEVLRGDSPGLRLADGSGLLDLLINIRECSVEVVEAILSWRDGFLVPPNGRPGTSGNRGLPPAFMYQGENYLLKMTYDLDFLAEVDTLVDALKVPQDKMRKNPFMTPFTLDDIHENESIEDDIEAHHQRLLDVAQVLVEEEILEVERAAFSKERLQSPSANNLSRGNPYATFGSLSNGLNASMPRPMTSASPGPTTPEMFAPGNVERHQKLLSWYEEACDQLYRLQYTSDPGFSSSYTSQRNAFLSEIHKSDPVMNPPSEQYPEDVFRDRDKPPTGTQTNRGPKTRRETRQLPFHDPVGLFSGKPFLGEMQIRNSDGRHLVSSSSSPAALQSSFQSPLMPGAFLHANKLAQMVISDPYSSKAVPVPAHAPVTGASWESKRQRIFQKQKDMDSRMASHSRNWGKGVVDIIHKNSTAWVNEKGPTAESTRYDPFGRNVQAGFVGEDSDPDAERNENTPKKKKKKKNPEVSANQEISSGPEDAWEAANKLIQQLSVKELQELLDATDPVKAIYLIAAATIILLTPADDMPSDVTFEGFKNTMLSEEDGLDSFRRRILEYEPSELPSFKVRALQPFLQNAEVHPIQLGQLNPAIQKLGLWVLQVLRPYEEMNEHAEATVSEWHQNTIEENKPVKKKKIKKKNKAPAPPQILYKQIQKLTDGHEYFISVTEFERDGKRVHIAKLFNAKIKPFEAEIPEELVREMMQDNYGISWIENELVPRIKVTISTEGRGVLNILEKKPAKDKKKKKLENSLTLKTGEDSVAEEKASVGGEASITTQNTSTQQTKQKKKLEPASAKGEKVMSSRSSVPSTKNPSKQTENSKKAQEERALKKQDQSKKEASSASSQPEKTDEREHQAAVKIQSKARQLQAKQRVQDIRENIQPETSNETEEDTDTGQYSSEFPTDSLVRESLEVTEEPSEENLDGDSSPSTKDSSEVDPSKELAAIKIQSIARKQQAKKDVLAKKQQKQEAHETGAAVKIQCLARRKQAIKKVETQKDQQHQKKKNEAATRIQALGRKRLAKSKVQAIRDRSIQQEDEGDDKSGIGQPQAQDDSSAPPSSSLEGKDSFTYGTESFEHDELSNKDEASSKQAKQNSPGKLTNRSEHIDSFKPNATDELIAKQCDGSVKDFAADESTNGTGGMYSLSFDGEEASADPGNEENNPDPEDEDQYSEEQEEPPVDPRIAQEAAATKIQTVQRQKAAREAVSLKRKQRKRNQAATKIQTKFRGTYAKTRVTEMKAEKWRREHFQGEVVHMGKRYHIYTDDSGLPHYYNPDQKPNPQRASWSMQAKPVEVPVAEDGEFYSNDYKADGYDHLGLLQMDNDEPTADQHAAAIRIQCLARQRRAYKKVSQRKQAAALKAVPEASKNTTNDDDMYEDDDYDADFSLTTTVKPATEGSSEEKSANQQDEVQAEDSKDYSDYYDEEEEPEDDAEDGLEQGEEETSGDQDEKNETNQSHSFSARKDSEAASKQINEDTKDSSNTNNEEEEEEDEDYETDEYEDDESDGM